MNAYEAEAFDGIWASASLLHVPKVELLATLHILKKALKEGGVLYLSFRCGEREIDEGDRYFNDQTEESLKNILEHLGGIETLYLGVSKSIRSRRGFFFTTAVVRKMRLGEDIHSKNSSLTIKRDAVNDI